MANDISFENREIAIVKTLRLEKLTSMIVKHMIGVSVRKSTKSLDNTSSSLSLKSRIDLLLDTEIIDKQTYKYLGYILSIRNQFAHNYACNNFEDLPTYLDGIEKHLLASSDDEIIQYEDKLKSGFIRMADAVTLLLTIELGKIMVELDSNLNKINNELVDIV